MYQRNPTPTPLTSTPLFRSERLRTQQGQGLSPVLGAHRAESLALQAPREHVAVDLVVVHHQEPPALAGRGAVHGAEGADGGQDRKSTRLNSSHLVISYAVLC